MWIFLEIIYGKKDENPVSTQEKEIHIESIFKKEDYEKVTFWIRADNPTTNLCKVYYSNPLKFQKAKQLEKVDFRSVHSIKPSKKLFRMQFKKDESMEKVKWENFDLNIEIAKQMVKEQSEKVPIFNCLFDKYLNNPCESSTSDGKTRDNDNIKTTSYAPGSTDDQSIWL